MAPRKPIGPNDPDNPNARRNQPVRPTPPRRPAQPPAPRVPEAERRRMPVRNEYINRPGFRDQDNPREYDDWWRVRWEGWAGAGWDLSDPWVRNYIMEQHWLRGDGAITDISIELENRGFAPKNVPGSFPRGGSGRYGSYRGGSGGGGMSTAQQYAQAEAAVRNVSGSLGAGLDDNAIKTLAKTLVDKNWSNDMLFDHLVKLAVPNTASTGMVTTGAADIKRLAAEQLLTVSDATAREWAGRIASDEMSIDDVRTILATQATQKYGWAADSIANGISVRNVLLPTRDRLAQELEMQPEDIDLMDSKYLSLVQTTDDNGVTRAATDSEVVMRARKRPEWANTRAAAGLASDMTQMMRNIFGG